MTSDLRYDGFGWDYARFNPLEERALEWYRAHARAAGGPILELACGTGRLLAALAGEGYDVVGLDRSEAMLRQAREHLGAGAALVQADMRTFDLERSFALAIIADNSLREIESEEGIVACLRHVRQHLQPGGRLLVTERRFDPGRYPEGVAVHPWTSAGLDPRTGEALERKVRVRLDPEGKRLHGVMTYRVVGSGSATDLPFESLVLLPADYRRLFWGAGFESYLFVGYEARADDGVDSILCFVCTART